MKEIFETRNCLSPDEIKGYLNATLSDDEMHSIEKHLVDCELCSISLEGWAKIDQPDQIIAELEKTGFKGFNENPSVETDKKEKAISKSGILLLSAAAIAVIVVSFFFVNQFKSNPQKLFKANYQLPEMPDPTIRNAIPADVRELTNNAYRAFSQKDFSASINYFEAILLSDSKNPSALFFGGLSYLETGQYEKAIDYLDKTASLQNTTYAEDANWYLALALLANKDLERSREVLRDIITKKGYFAGKAGKLIEQLDRI